MVPGSLVADRFAIERLAGRGAMGEVYRAVDRATGEAVALKVLGVRATAADAARFEIEAAALAGLGHPGIVRYVAHGEALGHRYLAMEWLEGEDLAERLRRGPLGVRETAALRSTRGVAAALGASHARGVVHRDLKPSNLFLPGGAIDEVKIIDFGIARLGFTASAAQAGMVMGTPGYMAPEQVQGHRTADARVDVFALGCVLYECLTGEPAFAGFEVMALLVKILIEEVPPLRSRVPEVPAALEQLVARMLAKAPGARPGSGPALAAELRALAVGDAVIVAPIDAPPSAALTRGEQRVLSVVLVEAARRTTAVLPDDATLATAEVSSGAWTTLAATVVARGGQLRVLGAGAVAVTLAGTGLATDQAARAAGCALAARRLLPGPGDRPRDRPRRGHRRARRRRGHRAGRTDARRDAPGARALEAPAGLRRSTSTRSPPGCSASASSWPPAPPGSSSRESARAPSRRGRCWGGRRRSWGATGRWACWWRSSTSAPASPPRGQRW